MPEGGKTHNRRIRKRERLRAFLEHQGRAMRHTGAAFKGLVPKETRVQARHAMREWLLSFQVLVEGSIQALETGHDVAEAPTEPSTSTKPARKVKVEVQ